ncbi:MAG: hypothetical protein AB8B69_12130, partial [Chitinophagales bacterium]
MILLLEIQFEATKIQYFFSERRNFFSLNFAYICASNRKHNLKCPGGGIGRHASLRGWCLIMGVQVRVLF